MTALSAARCRRCTSMPDHVFVVLHGPEPGSGGHVHHIELAQFIGSNWVLTVHGRMEPDVTLDAAYVETASISRKLESGAYGRTGPTNCRPPWLLP